MAKQKKISKKWDQRYSELAEFVASWSKDPKAQVGAVLLNRRNWLVALGYNGFSQGLQDDEDKLKDGKLKNKMIVHAEQNALLFAGTQARGGTIYVQGKPVCPLCAAMIIQAGVRRVVAIQPDPKNNPGSDTHKNGGISLEMFREAGVDFSPCTIKQIA